jgi:hypothetical protein
VSSPVGQLLLAAGSHRLDKPQGLDPEPFSGRLSRPIKASQQDRRRALAAHHGRYSESSPPSSKTLAPEATSAAATRAVDRGFLALAYTLSLLIFRPICTHNSQAHAFYNLRLSESCIIGAHLLRISGRCGNRYFAFVRVRVGGVVLLTQLRIRVTARAGDFPPLLRRPRRVGDGTRASGLCVGDLTG